MNYIKMPKSFERLVYKEGELFWVSGRKAGTLTKEGYLRVKYDGKSYLVHRIVWAMFNGTVPDSHIDHIDQNTQNNKIENLRPATNGQNFANSEKVRSSSGYRGVYPSRDRWKVLCAETYLGVYKDKEEAKEVFNTYARERWGEFWGG